MCHHSVTSPEVASKLKRQSKNAVESELAKALERLEIEESTTDELKKAHLTLRRAMQKVGHICSILSTTPDTDFALFLPQSGYCWSRRKINNGTTTFRLFHFSYSVIFGLGV